MQPLALHEEYIANSPSKFVLFLPLSTARIAESFRKGIVIDLQLCNLHNNTHTCK